MDPLYSIEFRRGVVQPVECLKESWAMVKEQYWLFFGISAVGMIIGSLVPFGILLGPMMCGIYLAFFQTRRGQPIEFGTLFKGFDYFGDSVVATLLHMVPIMVVFVPSYIIFYVAMIVLMQQGNQADPARVLTFFVLFAVFWLIIVVIIMIMSVLFTFAYPLIVDRRLSGLNAVKLSFRAALANFWRLLGLILLNGLLGFVGVLVCYVGVLFVLPITFGALAIAYERVFGLGEVKPIVPPPPPTFS